MLRLLRLLLVLVTRFSCSRRDLLFENLALRQQLITLKQKNPRPRVAVSDKLFWVLLRRIWPEWKRALIFVQPETVVRWHRAGFKLYWEWLSRHRTRAGRKCVSIELRELIFRMVRENPTWGAPRIHGELRMLGFDISERSVQRWMGKAPRSPEPAKRWATFLSNHREAIAAMDFFTVPTLTFGVLYCFFVIAHDRRRILGCSVTKHPTSAWIIQQLREALPYDLVPGYLIFDRATNFNKEVIDAVKNFGIRPKRTSFRSPWQLHKELLDTIRAAYAGKKTISPEASLEIVEHAMDDSLTPAEISVLRLIAAGRANKEIADQLSTIGRIGQKPGQEHSFQIVRQRPNPRHDYRCEAGNHRVVDPCAPVFVQSRASQEARSDLFVGLYFVSKPLRIRIREVRPIAALVFDFCGRPARHWSHFNTAGCRDCIGE
jgi:putative transposase